MVFENKVTTAAEEEEVEDNEVVHLISASVNFLMIIVDGNRRAADKEH